MDNDEDVVTLRVNRIKQLGDFIQIASETPIFREKMQAIFEMPDNDLAAKKDRQLAMQALFTTYNLVYSDERYDTLTALHLARFMKEGEVYEMLRDFATAFGHPGIGVFN